MISYLQNNFRVTVIACLWLCLEGSFCFSTVFKFEDQSLSVPDGFIVERIAGHPLTDRPITADFDELGRLYIAESSGSNEDPKIQLAEKPHSILRLEDTDGDGVFDKRTVFADRMMFPEGTLWHDGSLYVTAPPEIWKLTDTDDDGVADRREVWFNPGTLTGCANDLHGPYKGLDGWIYWCKGAFAEQKLTLTNGEPFVTRASHIFRRHPDGGGVEPVMTGGMDNPVELAFMPGGERIFSATFVQHPGGGRRDGLIHAIYGGTYGKIHGVIDEHPRTGEVLPILTQLGPAAACALMRYESGAFGPGYRNNLFASSFNLRKVTRHQLTRDGATFSSKDSDFLVSDNPDFHPTHIVEDADGSLIVIDTGGWYKLCCPTSQLHKPDVLGSIYRISKAGSAKIRDPRGLQLDWQSASPETLAARLADDRFMVRRRAVNQLARTGQAAIPPLKAILKNSPASEAREAAVWTLTRLNSPEAKAAVLPALTDPVETVRQAALHSIALGREDSAIPQLSSLVVHGSTHNRRAAAEALGRIGDSSTIPALLAGAEQFADRILEHSIMYALIEINDPRPVRPALRSSDSHVLRTALIAMDQMPAGNLLASEVIPFLQSDDALILETAEWIASRHADWGEALADYFHTRFKAGNLAEEEGRRITSKLTNLLGDASIQQLLAEGLESSRSLVRSICLQALQGSGLKEVPEAWYVPLADCVQKESPQLPAALAILRSLPLQLNDDSALRNNLETVSREASIDNGLRLLALEALSTHSLSLEEDQMEFLGASLDARQPMSNRSSAAAILGKAALTPKQLFHLTDFLKVAGPLEMKTLLTAFENHNNEALGFKLVESLKSASAVESLRTELLEPVLKAFPESVQTKAHELLATINQGQQEQAKRVEVVLASLPKGDIRRGQAVFNSPDIACKACHAIGYLGGQTGPDLTTVGTVRTERDLLEAVLYPSASFVRSYEPYQVTTKNGMTYMGILREETSEEIELLIGINLPVKIARKDIATISAGSVSLMPSGLTASLSQQELADLIAFLKATKWR